jgi:hypothetical protein
LGLTQTGDLADNQLLGMLFLLCITNTQEPIWRLFFYDAGVQGSLLDVEPKGIAQDWSLNIVPEACEV